MTYIAVVYSTAAHAPASHAADRVKKDWWTEDEHMNRLTNSPGYVDLLDELSAVQGHIQED